MTQLSAANNFIVSVCVPAFNEEENIRAAVEDLLFNLSPAVRDLEVIIVDDGSTDSTPLLADNLVKEYPQVKTIHHKSNSGVGNSYRDALAIANGDYFTWFPSDHENSAQELVQCLKYLNKDIIVTSHHKGHDPRPFSRRLISRFYTFILNNYFHLNFKYYNGLTIFPTKLLRALPLKAKGFMFNAENVILTVKSGCHMIELQAPLGKRAKGRSKALTVSSFSQILRDFFCIVNTERMINLGNKY